MRLRLRFLLPVLALLLVVPTTAHAADKPNEQALYQDGPDGRYLLDGDWLFRLDNADQGIKQRFMRQTSTSGWTKVKVPNVWNLGDASNESMSGGIGWYRKDFELPSADSALAWAFRFESVNYRARVWLNGKPIGENTGAYVPFELVPERLQAPRHEPARGARGLAPHHRLPARRPEHRRRPDRRLVELLAASSARSTCASSTRSTSRRPWSARCCRAPPATRRPGQDQPQERHPQRPAGHGHGQVRQPEPAAGDEDDRPRRDHEFADNLRVANPRLWSPANPNLYDVSFTVRVGGDKVAGYSLKSGIRSIKVSNGRLILNGQLLNTRGLGLHEDSKAQGFAIDNERREELVAQAKELGATSLRTHYPLHPYTHELADRRAC